MPKYTYPPVKEHSHGEVATSTRTKGEIDEYQRRVTIAVNKEILMAMKKTKEKDVMVTLHGQLIGFRDVEGKNHSERSIEIEVESVDAYPSDYESDKDFEEGYDS